MINLDNIKLVACDFDGVICNGLKEYFETSKKAYFQLYNLPEFNQLDQFQKSFYRLRPVVEVGWEMPILLRALIQGISEENIISAWGEICQKIVQEDKLDPKIVGKIVDSTRDHWISTHLEQWLSLHNFYPKIIHFIKQEIVAKNIKFYIISTKEGRFIKQLLSQEELNLSDEQIIGKEIKQPKAITLTQLIAKYNYLPSEIAFIEDRLPTLRSTQNYPELQGIHLFLADWGYNTPTERTWVKNQQKITLFSL